jgi:ABC-2 type transport system permease protein
MSLLHVARTSASSLRRDRGALALSFVLPVAFFTIFALVFGGRSGTTPRVRVIAVDEDHSPASERLLRGLAAESLTVQTRREEPAVDYTAATAEAAVKAGVAPVALVIPAGFGAAASSPGAGRAPLELLRDPGDPIAPKLVTGLVQKVVLTALPDLLAARGASLIGRLAGGLTPEQQRRVEGAVEALRARGARGADPAPAGDGLLVSIAARDVVGTRRQNPMISFYAAAIGVMFLLFTASGAGGSLLDEAESGALDRVLASQVGMGTLLGGKLLFATLLALAQLSLMFLWAAVAFRLELRPHLAGLAVMGLATSFAVAAFGMLLASVCRTRAQLGSLSTLLILVMSSIGGSMFPRYLMPEALQRAGLFTLNAWAIDGFTKVLWRDEPVARLWPEVAVLIAAGVVLFAVARRLARRWEAG